MPNWCFTKLYIKGPKEEVKCLEKLLNTWLSKSTEPTDFGDSWLGNVVHGAGFKTCDEDVNGLPCRGYVQYVGTVEKYRGKNEYYINVEYESAWYSMNELWYAVLEKYAPNCEMYWYAEEPGTAVFETNDIEKIFFEEEYVVSCYLNDNTLLYEMFENGGSITGEALKERLSKVLGEYSLPVLISKANNHELKLGEDEDFHVYEINRVSA